jgi:RimJ/RimL family protein N-acetyltransferase
MDAHPFEGRLVRLRAREMEDVPHAHRWVNNPAVTRNILVRYPSSQEQQRRWFEDRPPAAFAVAAFIIETLSGKAIGDCNLHSYGPEMRQAGLGILIGEEDHWGAGYGTDAMRLLCRFGFEMMNLHRIELDVFDDNPRAIRCYEKVGFQHEGRRREADYRYGRYRDVLMMGLLRSEFAAGGEM